MSLPDAQQPVDKSPRYLAEHPYARQERNYP